MKPKLVRRPDGEARRSQVLTTYGPGAMVDLPNVSVLVAGLEFWYGVRERIEEERLEARLAQLLSLARVELRVPPTDTSRDRGVAPKGRRPPGIRVFRFPEWFVAQVERTWKARDGREFRTRPLVHVDQLYRNGWTDEDRKWHAVVPIRFVQACPKGHLSDIDWHRFAYGARVRSQLWLDEGGAGNDFAEIYVRDESTQRQRPLSAAKVPMVLGMCTGATPWLGAGAVDPAGCRHPNRLLVRSASNAHFAQRIGVIAIPDLDAELRECVGEVYEDFLKSCDDIDELRFFRKKQERVRDALEGFTDEAVWTEVDRRRRGLGKPQKTIKQAEIEALTAAGDESGGEEPRGEFFARRRLLGKLPPVLDGRVERVVLAHRLRSVTALLGFTRFEPPQGDLEEDLTLGVELAPIARPETTWRPAVETLGEGVFIGFSATAIAAWMARVAASGRAQALNAGWNAWARRWERKDVPFGLPYVMLHSLSHLLISTVSLDCGYAASSISERIYAGASGYGILLCTGAGGTEGTLGGLVEVGRRIEHHLERALEAGRLCSNDPVCAQHTPSNSHEERFLHGAACHGCLLIAETSCERQNELLDRALVVPTVATEGAAFFDGGE